MTQAAPRTTTIGDQLGEQSWSIIRTMAGSRGLGAMCSACSVSSFSLFSTQSAKLSSSGWCESSRMRNGRLLSKRCSPRLWPLSVETSSRPFSRLNSEGLKVLHDVEGAVTEFILDGAKTTSIAHKIWRNVVKPGDTVIDATCGNGHDTVMLAKLALQEGTAGYVIGLDIQESALQNTAALLDKVLESSQRKKSELVAAMPFSAWLACGRCVSKVLSRAWFKHYDQKLVSFNLGYLPGGNKSMITKAQTTVEALHAATRVIEPQGVISVMSYVGHPGGQEEYEAVRELVSGLPPSDWVCSHLEWVNRPLCPHLIFMLKK